MFDPSAKIRVAAVGWAKAQRAVPTTYPVGKAVGTLRFAHPTQPARRGR
jgi:hypothetical protein